MTYSFHIILSPKRLVSSKKESCSSKTEDGTNHRHDEDYVDMYIRRTLRFRIKAVIKGLAKPTQLFLSHLTGKPVQRASISHWIREVMELSGIDIGTFKPGSTRGASSSMATRRVKSLIR